MKKKLLIVGASVRAQVVSAIGAGFSVAAYDLFADHDCKLACDQAGRDEASIARIDSLDQIVDIVSNRQHDLSRRKPGVAILCGGIEQCHSAMKAVEDWMPIAGCSTESMTLINDWSRLAEIFKQSGCFAAATVNRLPVEATPADWLRKPVVGAGGMMIRLARDSDLSSTANLAAHIYQQRIQGHSWSALFAARDGESTLVGVTRQLVGDRRFTNSPFAYCGSVGPLRLKTAYENQLLELGKQLTQAFHIPGLFGVDFILNERGIWPVDINPRITASAELFEAFDRETEQPRAFNMILAQLGEINLATCSIDNVRPATRIRGKAVVFHQTPRVLHVTRETLDNLCSLVRAGLCISDIPNIGAEIAPDQPMATVHVSGVDQDSVESSLVSAAEQLTNCWG